MLLYMDSPNTCDSSRSGGCLGLPVTAGVPASARARTPPDRADGDQFDGENEQRRLHHRANSRWDDFRLDVEGVPLRQTSPVATLACEPVPDREGDRHELAGRERGA